MVASGCHGGGRRGGKLGLMRHPDWRNMMTWHTMIGAYVFARIMRHVSIWLV